MKEIDVLEAIADEILHLNENLQDIEYELKRIVNVLEKKNAG